MPLIVEPDHPALRWVGAAELVRDGDRWTAWRLPRTDLATAHAPDLVRTAGMPAGVHAVFRTAATRLEIDLDCDPVRAPLDVLVDGELAYRGLDGREQSTNSAGLTLAEIRDEVVTATTTRQRVGDPDLHLVDGPSILGHEDAHLLHDGVHPSASGYRVLGARLAPVLKALASPDRPRPRP